MKPASIKKFDWLYLGSIVVAILGIALNYETIVGQVGSDLAAQGAGDIGGAVVIGGLLFGVALSLAFWFVISVLRFEFAKWLLILLTAWTVLTTASAISKGFDPTMIGGLVSTIMTIAAIAFLFKPDAKAWFAERKNGGEVP